MEIIVPGRTELAGNHTDHQGGHVLAAAINLLIRGSVLPCADEQVRLRSAGFGELIVDLSALGAEYSRSGTGEALVRGVLEYLRREGWEVHGFTGELCSAIPAGAGLSSSAAFSVWVGKTVSLMFNEGEIPPMTLALAARYAENAHFGKPCGLMDQCACAFGGVTAMSFHEPLPAVHPMRISMERMGYALCVVQTGGNHRDLTEDYTLITREMGEAAAVFGQKRLSDVSEDAFRAAIPELRRKLGDRAILRALHFFDEDRRAQEMADALERGDMHSYLVGMDASGRSSAELLQNSFSPSNPRTQGISLAMAISRGFLAGRGAVRVHGGGFAGTIQTLMPEDLFPHYRRQMESVFGTGCCIRLGIVDP
jgi:galactokinase